MSQRRRCALCGIESATDVKPSMVRWKDPLPDHQFDTVDRCIDRQACRDRVDAIGELWPVIDAGERSESIA
jgi:hypothetical protein